jgi:SMC interacting uncharacterized protein involved in chromosome segregation
MEKMIKMALAYISAGIESDLHSQITKEAKRNNKSFSAQIREYRDKSIVLEQTVDELRTEIKKITDVN